MKNYSISLDDNLAQQLDDISNETGFSKSELIRMSLKHYFEDKQDFLQMIISNR